MHFRLFNGATKGPQEELTMHDENNDEPPEEFFLSFDIISDDEIAELQFPFQHGSSSSLTSAASSSSISSQGSCSSLGSAGMHSSPSVIKKSPLWQLSRKQNDQQRNMKNTANTSELVALPPSTGHKSLPDLTEEELMSASIRIWYLIQMKGHNHDPHEDDYCFCHDDHQLYPTMENFSMTRTNWFHSLLHLHEKIKQHAADKHRFNVNNIPNETREQLKHLYVY